MKQPTTQELLLLTGAFLNQKAIKVTRKAVRVIAFLLWSLLWGFGDLEGMFNGTYPKNVPRWLPTVDVSITLWAIVGWMFQDEISLGFGFGLIVALGLLTLMRHVLTLNTTD